MTDSAYPSISEVLKGEVSSVTDLRTGDVYLRAIDLINLMRKAGHQKMADDIEKMTVGRVPSGRP